MADFICFEAEAEENDINVESLDSNEEEEEMIIDDFIDDSYQENDTSVFHRFHNQTTNTPDIMEELLREEESISEAHNYIEDNEIAEIANEVYDESENFLQNKNKFLSTLIKLLDQTGDKDSFCLTLLHAIRYVKTKKKDLCLEENLEKEIGNDLYSKINSIKENCILDLNLNHFEEMWYNLNDILVQENMFLRIYEIKDKYRYLFHENKDSKNCLRSLSSCIKEKFNGFRWCELKLSAKEKTNLLSVNILYKPIKKSDDFVKCYFVNDLKNAYRTTYEKSLKQHTANTLYECYY